MFQNKKNTFLFAAAIVLLSSFIILKEEKKPTLFFVGDSTVKNGKGDGAGNMWGWGDLMAPLFDTTKISLREASPADIYRPLLDRGVCQ